jgi:hypothetical protein
MSLGLFSSLQRALQVFVEKLQVGRNESIERLTAEVLWVISNLQQKRVEVWRLAVNHGVVNLLLQLLSGT